MALPNRVTGTTYHPYRAHPSFSMTPDTLCRRKEISPGAKLVFGYLVRCSGKDGLAFPSMGTIAETHGISDRQARRFVAELEKLQLIRRVSRFKDNQQKSNCFEFIWQEWMNDTRTVVSAPTRTDTSARKEQSEKTSVASVSERLARNSASPIAAPDNGILSTALHLAHLGADKAAKLPTLATVNRLRTQCELAAGAKLTDDEIMFTLQTVADRCVKPRDLPRHYSWWIVAAANVLSDVRNGRENYRPEDSLPSVETAGIPEMIERCAEVL